MIVYATLYDVDDVEFDCRGFYRPGSRSRSYEEPDEPATFDDVEVCAEGSDEWQTPEEAGLKDDDVVEALHEAKAAHG